MSSILSESRASSHCFCANGFLRGRTTKRVLRSGARHVLLFSHKRHPPRKCVSKSMSSRCRNASVVQGLSGGRGGGHEERQRGCTWRRSGLEGLVNGRCACIRAFLSDGN